MLSVPYKPKWLILADKGLVSNILKSNCFTDCFSKEIALKYYAKRFIQQLCFKDISPFNDNSLFIKFISYSGYNMHTHTCSYNKNMNHVDFYYFFLIYFNLVNINLELWTSY